MDVGENMLVNQGEEAFEEGEKAKKTVKATKASMKEYAAATVFLVLRMEETLVPAMGTYLVASAMEVEGCKNKRKKWRCHYCGKYGHIKPFCYHLHGHPHHGTQSSSSRRKMMWVPKHKTVSLVVHTSLRASAKEDWYLDSGCSRHMSGV